MWMWMLIWKKRASEPRCISATLHLSQAVDLQTRGHGRQAVEELERVCELSSGAVAFEEETPHCGCLHLGVSCTNGSKANYCCSAFH